MGRLRSCVPPSRGAPLLLLLLGSVTPYMWTEEKRATRLWPIRLLYGKFKAMTTVIFTGAPGRAGCASNRIGPAGLLVGAQA